MIAATCGRPITIYGDGKQVRDILYVDDLLDAFDAAAARIDSVAGCAFNIGGGPENVLAILELIQFLAARSKQEILFGRADWRPGDQRAYVSDIRLAERVLDWKPRISKAQGLELLYEWVCRNRCEFS
jgi:CDP-paratose 2-epimerase